MTYRICFGQAYTGVPYPVKMERHTEQQKISLRAQQMNSNQNPEPFYMPIVDVFNIKGRGTVVTGRIMSGELRKGDPIQISGKGKPTILTTVTDFIGFIRDPNSFVAVAGDNCGILLREVQIEQLEPGMIVTTPGST